MTTKIHVEVFIAARLLAQRTDRFSADDLRREVEVKLGDARSGVTTHISAHCVANAPRNAATVSNYLWRLPSGELRPFDAGRDRPHPSRVDARTIPDRRDVPSEYRYLLSHETT